MSVLGTSKVERIKACAKQAIAQPSGFFWLYLRIFEFLQRLERNGKVIWTFLGLAGAGSFATTLVYLGQKPIHWAFLAVVALLTVGLISFSLDFYKHWSDFSRMEILSPSKNFKPIDSTTRLLDKLDDRYRSEGEAIELLLHPAVTATKTITDNGWHPAEVEIKLEPGFLKAPRWKDKKWPNDGKNLLKYALIEAPSDLSDRIDKLQLRTIETDWENARRTQEALRKNEALRHEHMVQDSLLLKKTPNILCLHALCLTADNHYFILDRKSVEFHSDKLSISFEEQLDEKEFLTQGGIKKDTINAEGWCKRGLCEEIFPLRGTYEDDVMSGRTRAWDTISSYVDSMKIWSLFIEESIANPSVFMVCRLRITAAQYKEVFNKIEASFEDRLDREGRLGFVSITEMENFVRSGHANGQLAFKDRGFFISHKNLHPTSLYRLTLVHSCLTRG